jgi:hypothetical protein
VRQSIAASPAQVWDLISTPGHLEECHPFCRANIVDRWPGPRSHDTIEYYNGRVVERSFTNWLEGEGYDLDVSDRNGPSASVSWRLAPTDTGADLTIELTPSFLAGVGRGYRWAIAPVARPLLRRYLRSVVRGVEWRVTTGEPVRPNHFGTHLWFSRAFTRQ